MKNDNKYDVQALLPHRPPMLLVDRILELNEERCVALKNISQSEPCFTGHFPGNPVFPGVLTIEALAQTCSIWLGQKSLDSLPIFAGIQSARFLRMIVPGDQLRLEGRCTGEEKGFYTFEAIASVDGEPVCKATLVIVLRH